MYALHAPDADCFEGIGCNNMHSIALMNVSADCGLTWLSGTFPNVAEVDIFQELSTRAVKALLSLPNLKKVTYRGEATDEQITHLADSCPLLTHMTLIAPSHVCNRYCPMVHLFSHCTQLESIVLNECWLWTNATVCGISAHLSNSVKHIKIFDCPGIFSLLELRQCRVQESLPP